jgi:Terminase RNaseH-like domain
MASLTNWFREFRKYHRDDKGSGKIVKRDDHLMDATRYLIISGSSRIRTKPHPNQASTQASWRRCDVVVRGLT